jgi:hypothetical protein
MKKIKTTDITTSAAMPVKQGTLDHLQSAYTELFQGFALQMISSLSQGIIYGCRNTQLGANWSITSGYVYYNNEIFLCDAANGTLGAGQSIYGTITTTNLTAANADPVEFSNGLTYNVHEIRKIVWSSGTSGTVLFTTIDNNRFGRWFSQNYSSTYLTANVGTWTIGSGADWNVKYNIIGKTVTVCIEILNYTNNNSAAVSLGLQLEGFLIAERDIIAIGFVDDTGGGKLAQIKAVANSNILEITILSGIDNPTFTNFNAATAIGKLKGQITFEILPAF